MTPQELKNSILQLAIQGKLVEQRPEEGTGEELYRQIQAEKQKLIREGKIKKEKPLPEIAEDEVPFDIPESWKWVRLGDCSSYAQAKVKISPLSITSDMWSLDLEDIEKETGRIHTFCKAAERKISGDRVCFAKGQILYSKLRPYLKKILVAPDAGICTPELVPFSVYGGIRPDYIANALRAPHVDFVINSVTYGVKMPRVGTETMVNLLIPLPPLAEQKRIVGKIEELLPLIDRYEKAWGRLEEFNRRFPADMQKSLLQMAIQGKLVEQRPEEGTGEELYRQIQAEKQRLIKEGIIKKEKPLPDIAEDEVPFEIPESWKWVRLPAISASCLGKMLDKQKNTGISMPYLRNVNVRWGSFDLSDLLEMKFEDVNDERFLIRKNDLVMCEGGEPGRCAIWAAEQPIHFQKACHRLRFSQELHVSFFYFLFCLYAENGILKSLFTGTTIKHLTGQSLDKIVVPLPPLVEQKRIVAKLEELLPLCERLK